MLLLPARHLERPTVSYGRRAISVCGDDKVMMEFATGVLVVFKGSSRHRARLNVRVSHSGAHEMRNMNLRAITGQRDEDMGFGAVMTW